MESIYVRIDMNVIKLASFMRLEELFARGVTTGGTFEACADGIFGIKWNL